MEKAKCEKTNTYIDLFSGCGGLSLGLGWAGWRGVFAIEKDPMAYKTFKKNLIDESAPHRHFANWPSWLEKTPHAIEDILQDENAVQHLRKMSGQVTLVAGGPPAKAFRLRVRVMATILAMCWCLSKLRPLKFSDRDMSLLKMLEDLSISLCPDLLME